MVSAPSSDPSSPSRAAAAAPAGAAIARLDRAELEVADTVGALMEFWGFRRHLGRVWTLLYLSPEALGTAELAERLSLSSSAVSLALGELADWSAIKKVRRPGERRDFYVAEASIWKLLTRVVRHRELGLVQDAASALERAADELLAAKGELREPAQRARVRHVRKRLDKLRTLTTLGERLLGAFVSGRVLDLRPVRVAALPAEEERADAADAHDTDPTQPAPEHPGELSDA